MFTRNSDKEPPRAAEQPTTMPSAQRRPMPAGPSVAQSAASPAANGASEMSLIGSDLAIIGSGLKIVAQRTLKVDGEVQGDVLGAQIIIGQSGKVTGLVNAEQVQVNGAVFGTIKAVDVTLSSGAVVEGDIFHHSIVLEQGANFEGRSRRPKDRAELVPDLTVSNHSANAAMSSPGPTEMPTAMDNQLKQPAE